jgi:hypothetical protein
MKTFLFDFVAGTISALSLTIGAFAQTSNKVKVFEALSTVVIDSNVKVAVNKIASFDEINPRALSNFKKTYKDADDVKWHRYNNVITAEFVSNGINTRAYYNTKGIWTASIKAYQEEKLESKIRNEVKRTYYDYKIICIRELETISSDGIPTYFVYIKDETNFKILRIWDLQIDIFQQFIQQN